jgi:hypothetical protein
LNPLTILGYAFTTDELISSPTFTNSTVVNGTWNLGLGFSGKNCLKSYYTSIPWP